MMGEKGRREILMRKSRNKEGKNEYGSKKWVKMKMDRKKFQAFNLLYTYFKIKVSKKIL